MIVFIDFETAVCRTDPLLAVVGPAPVGRVRASLAWEALGGDVGALKVDIDPGFDALVAAVRGRGGEVVVVSDGLGVPLDLGVPVLANRADASGLSFPHGDRCCACTTCGTCKQAPIRDARRAGGQPVLVSGRGADHKAALLARQVFARGDLAAWCDANGVAFTPFSGLAGVAGALG